MVPEHYHRPHPPRRGGNRKVRGFREPPTQVNTHRSQRQRDKEWDPPPPRMQCLGIQQRRHGGSGTQARGQANGNRAEVPPAGPAAPIR